MFFLESTQLRPTKLTVIDVEFFRDRRKTIGFVLAVERVEREERGEGESRVSGSKARCG